MKRKATRELEPGRAQADSTSTIIADDSHRSKNEGLRSFASSLPLEPEGELPLPNLNKRHGLPPLRPVGSGRPGFSSFENSFERKRDVVNLRVAKLLESYLDTVVEQDPVPHDGISGEATLPASTKRSEAECSGEDGVRSRASLSMAKDGLIREVSAESRGEETVDTFRLFEDSPCGVMKVHLASNDLNSKRELQDTTLRCVMADEVIDPNAVEPSQGRKRRKSESSSNAEQEAAPEESRMLPVAIPLVCSSSSESDDDSVERREKVASVVVDITPHSGVS